MNRIIVAFFAVVVFAGCVSEPPRGKQPCGKPQCEAPRSRDASIDISPADPAAQNSDACVALLNFEDGGRYFGGSRQTIMWRVDGAPDEWDLVEMLVSLDSGREWVAIGRVRASKGEVLWTMPTTEGSRYRLKARLIREGDVISESAADKDFSITCGLPPCLPVVKETSKEHCVTVGYRLAPTYGPDEKKITAEEISRAVLWVTPDNGETWRHVGAFPADGKSINYRASDGRYGFWCAYAAGDAWSAPPAPGAAPQASLVIDSAPPRLEIRSPADDEEIPVPEADRTEGGRIHIVWDAWDANLGEEPVTILVSVDGGEWKSLGTTIAAAGLFEARLAPSDRPYRLRLVARDIVGNEGAVEQNRGFLVKMRPAETPAAEPTLTLLKPAGGGVLRGGSDQAIAWDSTGLGAVDIIAEFYDGRDWREIRRLPDTCGTFVWRVPEIDAAECRLRLRADLKYKTLTARSGRFAIDSAAPTTDIAVGLPEIEESPAASLLVAARPESAPNTPERGPMVMDTGSLIETVVRLDGTLEAPPRAAAEDAARAPEADAGAGGLNDIAEDRERLEKRLKTDEALKFIETRNWTAAEGTLKLLLNRYPGDAEVLYAMGRLYYDQCRYDDAAPYFYKAVEIAPAHARSQYYLGKIAMHAQASSLTEEDVRAASAETRFKEAIKNDPQMAEAHNDLATLYFEKKRFQEALVCFGRAVDADPANKIYLYNYGRTAFELGKYEDAVDFCDRAVKIDSSFPQAHWFIAKSYTAQRKWDKAAGQWQRVVDLFSFDRRLQEQAVRMLKEAQDHVGK